ncbi:MAG TPA: hypothetical protein VJB59_03875 [Bdellovibrionota bacterium]|nr:hypothetical protein [Bdellovibrionota bacterium]
MAATILLLGNTGESLAIAGKPDLNKLCSKSETPFALVETDLSARIQDLIASLNAPDALLDESEIRVYGPSPLCSGPYSPELQLVLDKVQSADTEEANGHHDSANKLRAEARLELRIVWDGLIAGRYLASSATVTDAQMDAYMKNSIEISRTAELLGADELATESLEQAAQKYGQWSENEQKRLRDEATAQAEEGYIDPELLQQLLEIARTNQALGNSETADNTNLDKLGNILAKRFNRLSKNMPCPPDGNSLRDLATAGREAALFGMDGNSISTALQKHAERYVRGQAQDADLEMRTHLAKVAESMGLDELSQKLQSGEQIDLPKCAKPGWTGTITFEIDQMHRTEKTGPMSGPAIGTEKLVSEISSKYTALMTIPIDGPPTAQVHAVNKIWNLIERRGEIDCGRPGINHKPEWKRWDVDNDQTYVTEAKEKTTISRAISVKDGTARISFQIPRLKAKVTGRTKYYHSGGCSKPEWKDLVTDGDGEIRIRSYVVTQTVDAQNPQILTGSYSDDNEGIKVNWNLEFQELKD